MGALGNFGIAINLTSGHQTAFVVADIGPRNSELGEVSIRLAENLGGQNVNPRNGKGSPSGRFLYLLFPNSGNQHKWPLSIEEIKEVTEQILNSVGGKEAIVLCTK